MAYQDIDPSPPPFGFSWFLFTLSHIRQTDDKEDMHAKRVFIGHALVWISFSRVSFGACSASGIVFYPGCLPVSSGLELLLRIR